MRIEVTRDTTTGPVRPLPRFVPPPGQTTWPPVQQWSDVHWQAWLLQHDGWTDSMVRQYLDHDRYAYGFGLLPNGDLANPYNREDATWLYLPTPQGVTLHATTAPNLLWGGSAGGSKSYSARWELWRCAFDPSFAERPDIGYRAIVVRRELEQLRRTHLDRFEREAQTIMSALGDPKAIKVTTQPACVTVYPTDAKIICAHCHNKGDENKYLSEDYDDMLADEATHLLPEQITGIGGRLRNDTKIGRVARRFLTTNPGGPAHAYCVDRFLTKTVAPEDDDPTCPYDPHDYAFIRSRLFDNPFYMDRDGTYTSYVKRLSEYTPQRRNQLLWGDWDTVVGQFFEGFQLERHKRRDTIQPRTAIEAWFRSGEGGKVPYACFVALQPDGRLYLFAELSFPHLTIGECASLIVQTMRETILPTTQGRWSKAIGSPDLFPDKPGGETPVETCRRFGLSLIRGDANTVFGWTRVKHWLRDHPLAGVPWLTIDPDCAIALRTLPTVVQDPENPDEIDRWGETQAAHAIRIGVMARPSPSVLEAPAPEVPAGAIKHLVDPYRFPSRRRAGMVS